MLCKLRGTTQADFARGIGSPPQRVSEWVSEKGTPSLKQAFRISRFFGVPLDYLADDEQDDPPSAIERKIRDVLEEIGPEEAYRRLLISPREGKAAGGILSVPPKVERKDVG